MTDRKLPAIPDIQAIDPAISRILRPMRELLHKITGRTGTPIARLQGTVTDDDRTNKLNEIIDRLNG
jgi:hypothetical protein